MTGPDAPAPATGVIAAPEPGAAEDPETPPDEPAPEAEPGKPWRRHPNGRWIVGDAGGQPDVVGLPPALVRRRPDVSVDGGRVAAIDYRAASLRGLGQLESGKPRQDSYVVTVARDDALLVGCVADGVSEGRLSHRAADLACEKIVGELIDNLTADGPDADLTCLRWGAAVSAANIAIKKDFLERWRSAHRDDGIDDDRVEYADIREHMSSTAVAFVVATRPDAQGVYRSVVAAIAGDSSALWLRDGVWAPVTEVKGEGQEVASSGVRPLPRETTPEPVPLSLRSGDVLTVITDGIGDPMGSGGGVVGRFFQEVWATPPDTIEFAHQVGFYRRTFMDDRTVVTVWVDPDRR